MLHFVSVDCIKCHYRFKHSNNFVTTRQSVQQYSTKYLLDGTRDVLSGLRLGKEGVEGVIHSTRGLVAGHVSIGIDAMLQAVQFPAVVTSLDTGLTEVDRDTFCNTTDGSRVSSMMRKQSTQSNNNSLRRRQQYNNAGNNDSNSKIHHSNRITNSSIRNALALLPQPILPMDLPRMRKS